MGPLICIIALLVGTGVGYVLYPNIFTSYHPYSQVVEKVALDDGEISIDVNKLEPVDLPHIVEAVNQVELKDDKNEVLTIKPGEEICLIAYERGAVEVSDKSKKFFGTIGYPDTNLMKIVAQKRLDKGNQE